ncbi:MAG: apolipoprotein N-acyltransferase [Oceanicaulis sp.]
MSAAGPASAGRRALARWRALKGWPLYAALFALGALGVFAHAPYHSQPVLIAGYVALVWSLDASRRTARPWRAGFARAWWFGAGQFLAGTFWVANAFLVSAGDHAWLIWAPLILLPGGLALFWGAAGALYARFAPSGPERVCVFAALFLIAELLRATILSGFPWNLPGHVFAAGGAVSQAAALAGAFGLSALVLFAFAAPAALAGPGAAWRRAAPALTGLALLIGAWSFGAIRLADADVRETGLTVRVVQLAIEQADKRFERREAILEDYLDLSAQPGLEAVDVLVWPEGAIPALLLRDRALLERIRDRLSHNLILVTGTTRAEAGEGGAPDAYFNALAVLQIDEAVTLRAVYDKVKLVPFGESNPVHALTRPLGLDTLSQWGAAYTPGPGARTLSDTGLPPFSPLICYEVVYARFAPRGVDRANWLVNVSNDSWYGNTTGPRQHFNQARYRAIEEGLPMVRAASKGVSGQIDPYGRPVQVLGLDANAALDFRLLEPRGETIYARHGDWPWLSVFSLLLLGLGLLLRRSGAADPADGVRRRV